MEQQNSKMSIHKTHKTREEEWLNNTVNKICRKIGDEKRRSTGGGQKSEEKEIETAYRGETNGAREREKEKRCGRRISERLRRCREDWLEHCAVSFNGEEGKRKKANSYDNGEMERRREIAEKRFWIIITKTYNFNLI